MDDPLQRCEAIALPSRPERDVQRVTSKVGMEQTSTRSFLFLAVIDYADTSMIHHDAVWRNRHEANLACASLRRRTPGTRIIDHER